MVPGTVASPRPDIERCVHTLLCDGGFLPVGGPTSWVVESGKSLLGLRSRCRLAGPSAAEQTLIVVMILDETGISRVIRWLVLPVQLSIAGHAIGRNRKPATVRFGVFPNLIAPGIMYELRSPAGRYAEHWLIPRPRATLVGRAVRALLARWAGCDLSAGAIIMVGGHADAPAD